MGRTARKRSEPHLPPVEKIELSSAHSGRKLALAALFLVVGVVAIVYALMNLYGAEKGWQQIEVSTNEPNCAGDFVLLYELGRDGGGASGEKKALTAVYNEAAVAAYRLFSGQERFEGVNNLRYISDHPNEPVTVDPALYRALEQIVASGDRTVYLAPVGEAYGNLFYCQDEALTGDFDPWQNEPLRAYFARCAAFAADPAAVDLELMGDGAVCLRASEAYLAFAAEEEIESLLDLGWMENAFAADYLADTLETNGFTHGSLSSYDGFMRNLDGDGPGYALGIYDRQEGGAVQAATLTYSGRMSAVYLRSFPLSGEDSRRMFPMSDGTVRTTYLDTADGLCRSAAEGLAAYAPKRSCGELALKMAPVYVADRLRPEALKALAAEGIDSVWCQDGTVFCTDGDARFQDLYEGYTVSVLE